MKVENGNHNELGIEHMKSLGSGQQKKKKRNVILKVYNINFKIWTQNFPILMYFQLLGITTGIVTSYDKRKLGEAKLFMF